MRILDLYVMYYLYIISCFLYVPSYTASNNDKTTYDEMSL